MFWSINSLIVGKAFRALDLRLRRFRRFYGVDDYLIHRGVVLLILIQSEYPKTYKVLGYSLLKSNRFRE